jgi:hypothetical protein
MFVALTTTVSLFVLHKWYATYLDVSFHDELSEGQASEALLAARGEQKKALESGKIPLAQAIDTLAKRGRNAASSIAPTPSSDLSAVSGWIHRPGFAPVTAHPVRSAPVAAKPAGSPETAVPAALPTGAAEPAPTNVLQAEPVPGSTRIRTGQGRAAATTQTPAAQGTP